MEKITNKTIEQENPHFVLEMIAEVVAEKAVGHSLSDRLEQWSELDKTGRTKLDAEYLSEVKKLTKYLCERANTHYQYNESFNKGVKGKGDKGRDYLYVFMYHWTGNHDGKFTHKDSYTHSMANWYKEKTAFESKEEKPYLETTQIVVDFKFNPKYNQVKKCTCGHEYHRHFDSYEQMENVGCKYCSCNHFTPAE